MQQQMKDDIQKIILEVVGVDVFSLDTNTVIATISEWDSFNNLMLISRFQEDMDIEFSAIDVENINTISDLLLFLEKKVKEKLEGKL